MKTFAIVPVFLMLSVSFACQGQHPGQAGYREINSIPRTRENDRKSRFLTYPIDEQIDIYLYSQYRVEGGSDEMLRFMASDGERKIPTILKRIDTDEDSDPRIKVGLIRALDSIDENCRCVANTDDAPAILLRNEMPLTPSDSEGVRGFKELYHQIRQRIDARAQTGPSE